MVELILSLGLAAVAFASFLTFFHSVRKQDTRLQRFATATLVLQSKLEELRLGTYGGTLDKLEWSSTGEGDTTQWKTAPQGAGRSFSWLVTSPQRPAAGELFECKLVVIWQEQGTMQRVSAATKMMLR
jgi:hypothetical protein